MGSSANWHQTESYFNAATGRIKAWPITTDNSRTATPSGPASVARRLLASTLDKPL